MLRSGELHIPHADTCLERSDEVLATGRHGLVTYGAAATLAHTSGVSRGLCHLDPSGDLESVEELRTVMERHTTPGIQNVFVVAQLALADDTHAGFGRARLWKDAVVFEQPEQGPCGLT